MYRVIFILFLLFLPGGILPLPAQGHKGLTYYDKTTYDAYLKGDWHTVIATGREALKAGIDFYYLRMRIGIAYYSKKNYEKAIIHFRKALAFNGKDIAAMQYLYYCYLFSGREADRHALMHHMPKRLREEVKAGKLTGLTGFELSAGYFSNGDGEAIDDYDPSGLPRDEGIQTLVRRGGEGAMLFTFQAGENTVIRAGYRFLSKNRLLHYLDYQDEYTLTDNTFTQHQLYGNLSFRLAEGLTLDLAFNYLNLRTVVPGSGYGNQVFLFTSSSGDGTTYLALQKMFPYFSLRAGAGFSGMNSYQQLQTDGSLIFYPLGNLNLYAGTGITYLMQGDISSGLQQQKNLIWNPFVGFRVAGTFWTELYASFGELSNYQSRNGWILYNDLNPVSFSGGINMLYVVPKTGMTLTFSPSWSNTTSYYFLQDDLSEKYNATDYHMLNFKLEIKWNF
jgi:tetratricopeptide (TPR) repeat protein